MHENVWIRCSKGDTGAQTLVGVALEREGAVTWGPLHRPEVPNQGGLGNHLRVTPSLRAVPRSTRSEQEGH